MNKAHDYQASLSWTVRISETSTGQNIEQRFRVRSRDAPAYHVTLTESIRLYTAPPTTWALLQELLPVHERPFFCSDLDLIFNLILEILCHCVDPDDGDLDHLIDFIILHAKYLFTSRFSVSESSIMCSS